ncbi:hypothetical protein TCAL_03506 [Tigriopus californicus]|uniref:G-protein coupled receptors family 1 profile domain-containing protein n=1 Tax=Tigriopus californicus TaxID=6832 RepID=A0A553PGL9_TIGCA|nr:hypothetical protein TCAL_03506 [Tigriopus californicus]
MTLIDVNISTIGPLTNASNMEQVESDLVWDGESWTNATLPDDMVFGEAQIISISVYSLLFVVSSVLNLNVLANLLLARKNVGLSRLNTLLLQLVLADLSVTFFLMPLEIIWAATVSWKGGDLLCRICSFFRIFGLFLSSNIVICISIDRFLAILKPFSVRSSSSRINRMLFMAWFLAVVLSLPQCWVFHLQYHPDHPWYGQCVTFGSFESRHGEFLYFFMGMIFLYILPLLVILFTYGGIVFHLHQKGITITKSNFTDESNLKLQNAKLNTIKITLTLVGVFLACWTPYYVICIW